MPLPSSPALTSSFPFVFILVCLFFLLLSYFLIFFLPCKLSGVLACSLRPALFYIHHVWRCWAKTIVTLLHLRCVSLSQDNIVTTELAPLTGGIGTNAACAGCSSVEISNNISLFSRTQTLPRHLRYTAVYTLLLYFFLFYFFFIPFIVLAILSRSLPVVAQMTGSHSGLSSPLPTTVRAFIFITRANNSAFSSLVDFVDFASNHCGTSSMPIHDLVKDAANDKYAHGAVTESPTYAARRNQRSKIRYQTHT